MLPGALMGLQGGGMGWGRRVAVPGLGVHSTVDGLSELPKLTDRLNVPPNPWQVLG